MAFALLGTCLALGGLELFASFVERIWPLAPLRPLPKPGAESCLPDCMPGMASLPEPPSGLPRGIPMVPHGRRAWSLAYRASAQKTESVWSSSFAWRKSATSP